MLILPLLLLCRYQWHTTQTLSLPKTHRWKLQYNVILGSLIVLLFLFEFDRVPIGVIKIRYILYWMQLLVFTQLCVTIFPAAYAISDFTLTSTCTDPLHSVLVKTMILWFSALALAAYICFTREGSCKLLIFHFYHWKYSKE